MALQINNSIRTFLKELKTRIELLSSNAVTANIDNSNITKINTILNSYNIASDKPIEASSFKQISNKDIALLLALSGQNNDSIEYIMSKMDEHLEKIAKIINKYISDYIIIGNSQSAMINEKINLYQKYIELFETMPTEPFEEVSEISKVMSEIGLSDEDKWRILEYIADINTKTLDEVDVNLSIRITREYENIAPYLENKEVYDTIKDRLGDKEIDIDTIPTIAFALATKTNTPESVMTNIVATLIARNLLNTLTKSGQSNQEYLIEIINSVLDFIRPIYPLVYYQGLEIKRQTQDYYYHAIENGITEEMIKEYLETPLSQIKNETVGNEEAIELKELSVLKAIYETLDTIEQNLEPDNLKKATNVLQKLIEQYKILEEKKLNPKIRIN